VEKQQCSSLAKINELNILIFFDYLIIADMIFKKKESNEENKKKTNPLKAFMYGFALHGNVTYMLRTRMYMEHLFMLMTLGDMLGFPILPPYYSLRLLPYMVPNIKSWKMRMLRERDITDLISG
jgi:hypothetical protein